MSDADDDGDVVAFDGDIEAESATGEAHHADEADDDTSFEGQANMATPVSVVTPRGTRPISDKVRAMFKDAAQKIAAQHKDDPDDDDDVAIIGDMEPAYGSDKLPAPAAATASETRERPAEVAAGQPVPPAPTMDPQVVALRDQWSAKLADLEAREQALATNERSGDVARLRDVYFEKGAPAIVEMVKRWTGYEGDELLSELADLVTDLSSQSLHVAVPDEVRNRIESKRAQKAVKSFKAEMAARELAQEEKAQKIQQAEGRSRAVTALGREMAKPDVAAKFQYLSAEDNAAELVFDVVEAQHKRDGTMLNWEEAAKRANEYLGKQASAWFDKRKHLLNAAPAQAGGVAKQGTEQASRETNQGQRRSQPAPQPTKAAPTAPQPVSNGKWDPEAHRRQTKQRMRAAFTRQADD